jgi:hypothetical protein
MPATNGDRVLAAYASFNSGNWEAASANLHPEFVWINDPDTAGVMGAQVELRGPAELREWWRGFFGQWEEWEMVPGEPLEGSEGRVFIPCRFSGRGQGSGVPIDFDFFQVWHFREGLPVRITNIRDREAALATAGIRDHSSQA